MPLHRQYLPLAVMPKHVLIKNISFTINPLFMEFIKVTLHQSSTSLQHGEKFSDLQQFENYLLPIAGIKYIEETQTEPGIFILKFVKVIDQLI